MEHDLTGVDTDCKVMPPMSPVCIYNVLKLKPLFLKPIDIDTFFVEFNLFFIHHEYRGCLHCSLAKCLVLVHLVQLCPSIP